MHVWVAALVAEAGALFFLHEAQGTVSESLRHEVLACFPEPLSFDG